ERDVFCEPVARCAAQSRRPIAPRTPAKARRDRHKSPEESNLIFARQIHRLRHPYFTFNCLRVACPRGRSQRILTEYQLLYESLTHPSQTCNVKMIFNACGLYSKPATIFNGESLRLRRIKRSPSLE